MDRCPHIITKCEGWDYCELSEKPSGRIHPCMLQSGEECRIWEEIKREAENENQNNTAGD